MLPSFVSISGTVESLHVFLLFGALQGHDTSFKSFFILLIDGDAATVECKMIFMYLSPRKTGRCEEGAFVIREKSEQDCF